MAMKNKLKAVWMLLKKIHVYYFHPEVIRVGLKERKGQCRMCGECCRNLVNMKIKCLFLKKNNLCSIYKFRKYLPVIRQLCYFFPSVKELRVYKDEYKDNKCGYYW